MAFFAALAASSATAAQRALIVGIDRYAPPAADRRPAAGETGRRAWTDLEGAVNDARALREILLARYGFRDEDVVLLVNEQATREEILKRFAGHLVAPSAPGDLALFFFAGHGSQVANSGSAEPDRMDESLVPADSRLGAPDLRDKELRALFNRALDRGAKLVAMLDCCHSGSGSRGAAPMAAVRALPLDPRDVADAGAAGPAPEARGALVLAAAQDYQAASEAYERQGDHYVTHGAFSLAMLDVLRTAAPEEPAQRLFLRIRARMQARGAVQEPVLSGRPEDVQKPLFARTNGSNGAVRAAAAVLRVSPEGTVEIQGGWASGFAEGCELRRVEGGDAPPVRLRIDRLQGLSRCEARVIDGDLASVTPGDLFALDRWPPSSSRALKLWPADRPLDLPAEASAGGPWRSAPVPAALVRALTAPGAGIAGPWVWTPEAKNADYWLVGREGANGLDFAWLAVAPIQGGASDSPYPSRTDWISGREIETAARELGELAGKLARRYAWLNLEAPPQADFPYSLALKDTQTGELRRGGDLPGGHRHRLVLRAEPGTLAAGVAPRYVYVFVLDSDGASTLVYPPSGTGNVENRLPVEAGRPPAEIELGVQYGLEVEVAEPYGTDVYMIITSADPLPNPDALDERGVRTRSAASASGDGWPSLWGGTRGPATAATAPLDWSIERLTFRSRPPAR